MSDGFILFCFFIGAAVSFYYWRRGDITERGRVSPLVNRDWDTPSSNSDTAGIFFFIFVFSIFNAFYEILK